MVELIVMYTTLSDLAVLDMQKLFQVTSLRPLLGHPERLGKKKFAYTIVTSGPKLGYALRNQNWRYAKWPDGEELYNLNSDPEEKQNLAGKPHLNERLMEFRQILAAKQIEAISKKR